MLACKRVSPEQKHEPRVAVHAEKREGHQNFTNEYGGSFHSHAGLPEICLWNANGLCARWEKLIDASCSPPELPCVTPEE